MGSFQAVVGLDIERESRLSFFTQELNINSRINVIYTSPNHVHITGLSTYGGTVETQGRIKPGDSLLFDLSVELSLTQHWVAVMEGLFEYQKASIFYGTIEQGVSIKANARPRAPLRARGFANFLPTINNLIPGTIGNGNEDEVTIAPAIEYNFAKHMGIIGGVWLIVDGKNTPSFLSASLSFHMIG